jgi:class 3 adenylate cyclase
MGKDIELAILFADVVGSTRIYEVMGDLRARDMVLTCVEIMRSATEQNHGTVIKTIGDEIMATFPTANDALNAGSRMQHDIRIHSELKVEGQPVAIRIGFHFGPVVQENRDVFGSAVHTANRLTSQAKPRQIVTTGGLDRRHAAGIARDAHGGAKLRLHLASLESRQRAAQQHVDTDEGRKDENRDRRAEVLQHAHARFLALLVERDFEDLHRVGAALDT